MVCGATELRALIETTCVHWEVSFVDDERAHVATSFKRRTRRPFLDGKSEPSLVNWLVATASKRAC